MIGTISTAPVPSVTGELSFEDRVLGFLTNSSVSVAGRWLSLEMSAVSADSSTAPARPGTWGLSFEDRVLGFLTNGPVSVAGREAAVLFGAGRRPVVYRACGVAGYAIVLYESAPSRLACRVIGPFVDALDAERYATEHGHRRFDVVAATTLVSTLAPST